MLLHHIASHPCIISDTVYCNPPELDAFKIWDDSKHDQSVQVDLDGVGHEVTLHVTHLLTAVVLPVLLANGSQIPHAFSGLRLLKQLLHVTCVLLPAVQPEAMDLQAEQSARDA